MGKEEAGEGIVATVLGTKNIFRIDCSFTCISRHIDK